MLRPWRTGGGFPLVFWNGWQNRGCGNRRFAAKQIGDPCKHLMSLSECRLTGREVDGAAAQRWLVLYTAGHCDPEPIVRGDCNGDRHSDIPQEVGCRGTLPHG